MKKFYTTPTLCVEEYEMTIITSTSPVGSTDGNVFQQNSITGGSGAAMGKNRNGIWDED